jgi:hypothetical protein
MRCGRAKSRRSARLPPGGPRVWPGAYVGDMRVPEPVVIRRIRFVGAVPCGLSPCCVASQEPVRGWRPPASVDCTLGICCRRVPHDR